MRVAPIPADEQARLRAVRELQLLDTPNEQEFDDITLLASLICQTPIALISLIDEDRQWFKSRVGIDVTETPRDISFCAHAILDYGVLEVPDATRDERFTDNPLVTGDLHLRFYAGVPLVTTDNHNVGTLCVVDREPRHLSDAEKEALHALGRQVMRLVELRRSTRLQGDLRHQLASETALNRAIVDNAGAVIISTDLDATVLSFNPAAEEMLGYRAEEIIGTGSPVSMFHVPEEVERRGRELSERYGEEITGLDIFVRPLRDAPLYTSEWSYIRSDGTTIPISLTLSYLRDDVGQPVGYLGVVRDLTESKARVRRMEASAHLVDIVRRSQQEFIAEGSGRAVFERLLSDILEHTESEYGFIGEVLHDEQGAPYLHTHAITDIAWSEATREFYDEHKDSGMIFRNVGTLFGAAMTTGEPVIANDPSTDPRRGGLPEGHPAMNSFLGLTLNYGGQLVGLIGLANRPGGYLEEYVRELAPLTASCAALIHAIRLEADRASARESLVHEKDRFRLIVDTAVEAFIEVDEEGRVTEWNLHAAEQLGIPVGEAIGRPVDELLTLCDDEGARTALLTHGPNELDRPGQALELTFLRADGSQFRGELVMWSMQLADSLRFCALIRDVTERNELEVQQRLRFESETLLKEIHHRVKNNMQVISSLLSIQSAQLKDEAQRDVFLDARERILAMSLIHDKLYTTGQYDGIDFGDYLKEMIALITSSNSPPHAEVRVDLQTEAVTVPVETAVPLSLIASELVLNSLKHAFRDRSSGTLTVRLGEDDGTCRLFIGDDGPGVAHPDPGHVGVGMQLIEALTRQIRAQCEQSAGPGYGTTIVWQQ